MRLLVKLSFQNLKSFLKESMLVIVSITMTVSLLTMVTSVMYGAFDYYGKTVTGEVIDSVSFFGEFNSYELLEKFGMENIVSYEATSKYKVHSPNNENDLYSITVFNNIDQTMAENGKISGSKITKGRLSSGIHELNVVEVYSGFELGEKVELINPSTGEIIISEVVGMYDSGTYVKYYESLNSDIKSLLDDTEFGEVSLVIEDGTKDLDSIISRTIKEVGNDLEVYTKDEYNYFKGFTNKAPEVVYFFIVIVLILLVLLSAVTTSFLMNAFIVFIGRRQRVFSILRSVGSTRKQLLGLMIIEGFSLALVGYAIGVLLGWGLGSLIIRVVNNTLSGVSLLNGSRDIIQLQSQTPQIAYALMGLFMSIGLMFAIVRTIFITFKSSAIEVVNTSNSKNKRKDMKLKGNPIKSLANINISRKRSFKSIRTTLIISMVLLISLTTWPNMFDVISDDLDSQFDTRLSVYFASGEDALNILYNDTVLMEKTLNNAMSIDKIYAKVSFGGYELQGDFVENKELTSFISQLDKDDKDMFYEIVKRDTDIVILSDVEFDLMASSMGISETDIGTGILKDAVEVYYVFEDGVSYMSTSNSEYGSELTVGDNVISYKGTTVELPDNAIIQVQDTEGLMDPIDIEVYKLTSDLGETYGLASSNVSELYISWSTFEKLSSKQEISYNYLFATMMLRTNMNEEEVLSLVELVSNYGGENHFWISSNALSKEVQKTMVQGVRYATILVFGYILLFIAINIISISIVNNEQRKSDMASLKSIGMTNEQMRKLFIYESFNVVGKGWLVGVFIAHGVGFIVYKVIEYYIRGNKYIQLPNYSLDLSLLFFTLLFAVGVMMVQVLLATSISKEGSIIEGIKRID